MQPEAPDRRGWSPGGGPAGAAGLWSWSSRCRSGPAEGGMMEMILRYIKLPVCCFWPHLPVSIMSPGLQGPRRHHVEALHHSALWEKLRQCLGVGPLPAAQPAGVADVHQHLPSELLPQPHQGGIVFRVDCDKHHPPRAVHRLPLRPKLHPLRKQTPGDPVRAAAAHHHPEATGHQPHREGAGEVSRADDADGGVSPALLQGLWGTGSRTWQQRHLQVRLHDKCLLGDTEPQCYGENGDPGLSVTLRSLLYQVVRLHYFFFLQYFTVWRNTRPSRFRLVPLRSAFTEFTLTEWNSHGIYVTVEAQHHRKRHRSPRSPSSFIHPAVWTINLHILWLSSGVVSWMSHLLQQLLYIHYSHLFVYNVWLMQRRWRSYLTTCCQYRVHYVCLCLF